MLYSVQPISTIFTVMPLTEHSYRSNSLDTYRGIAVGLMILFHFLWNLREFGLLSFDIDGPIWQGFRSIIVFMFVSALGCSSYLAVSQNHARQRFLKNQLKLGIAALFISCGTYLLLPSQWVFFGILQFLFIAGWLLRPIASSPVLTATAGLALVALSFYNNLDAITAHRWFIAAFNAPANTIDFINPLPWIGVAMIGPFLGYIKLHRLILPTNTLTSGLSWMGKNALVIYLLHQLILFPVAALISLTVR